MRQRQVGPRWPRRKQFCRSANQAADTAASASSYFLLTKSSAAILTCSLYSQGATIVKAEVRDGEQDRYGKGRRKRMAFGEFVEQAAAGNTSLYLSSQKVSDI